MSTLIVVFAMVSGPPCSCRPRVSKVYQARRCGSINQTCSTPMLRSSASTSFARLFRAQHGYIADSYATICDAYTLLDHTEDGPLGLMGGNDGG